MDWMNALAPQKEEKISKIEGEKKSLTICPVKYLDNSVKRSTTWVRHSPHRASFVSIIPFNVDFNLYSNCAVFNKRVTILSVGIPLVTIISTIFLSFVRR